jgi:hypothetical protein
LSKHLRVSSYPIVRLGFLEYLEDDSGCPARQSFTLQHIFLLAVSVIPEIAVAEEVSQKRLIILPWSAGRIEVATLMIWYRERWISPTLKAFMETTRKVLAPAAGMSRHAAR